MSLAHQFTPISTQEEPWWKRYMIDSALATAGALLLTGIIYALQLYPRIPNISIAYLPLILILASQRSFYAALLASITAFLAFDFFLVPPLFLFTINRVEEWLALCIFLVTAFVTSRLATALRVRAEQADHREREARILYELVRAMNGEEKLEHKLNIIAQSITEVFAPWGVQDCALLLPETNKTFNVSTRAHQLQEELILSIDEQTTAAWVMEKGETMGLYLNSPNASTISPIVPLRRVIWSTLLGHRMDRTVQFLPLKAGQQVVGVLRIVVVGSARRFALENDQQNERTLSHPHTTFFWTFLDQAASVIERARLRRDTFHLEILRRTDTLRAALLASVSHDLRTPLASIKAAASSLLQEDVNWDVETQRSFARAIEKEADRLNRLVGNLLDMSRIEGGALKPEKEWYAFDELVHDVLGHLQPLLQQRTILTNIPADLPPVELDYLQIDQVLTNLLENAVRYTPASSPITLSAHVEGNQLLVSVADKGPGIPAAERERIFDKFYRVMDTHRKTTSTPTGSGLGLAVCQGLIEAHGGRIWVQTQTSSGATFCFTLPLLVINK